MAISSLLDKSMTLLGWQTDIPTMQFNFRHHYKNQSHLPICGIESNFVEITNWQYLSPDSSLSRACGV